jgi:hypothetical protein
MLNLDRINSSISYVYILPSRMYIFEIGGKNCVSVEMVSQCDNFDSFYVCILSNKSCMQS